MQLLYSFIFKLFGWKIQGDFPDAKKYIVIVAPHTCTEDFFIGIAVRSIKGIHAKFLGKKELFKPPFGFIIRWFGGYPVDRSKHSNLVDAVVDLFEKQDQFVIGIAPEGTRKYVKEWKSGFYYMALKAKVPIVMAAFHFPEKTVYLEKPFYPSGNIDADKKILEAFFKNKQGKFPKQWPENF